MKNFIFKIVIFISLFFVLEYLNTGSIVNFFEYLSFSKIFFSIFWMITLYSFLSFILRSERRAMKITIILIGALSISNYIKMNNMYTTFKIEDIFLIKGGLYFTYGMNTFSFSINIIISLVVLISSFILSFFLNKINKHEGNTNFKKSILIKVMAIFFLINIFYTPLQHYLNNIMQSNFKMNTILNAQTNGFLPILMTSIETEFVSPNIETKENVEDAYDYFTREFTKKNAIIDNDVDVIFIMSESFSDPYELYPNLNLKEDLMPNIRKIQEESIMYGSFSSIAQTGGTCNVEYEVMSGYLNAFTPAGICFETEQPVNSLVRDFNDLGYSTTGIHPAPAKLFYDRINTFNNLGFKNSIFEEDLKNNFEKYKYYGPGLKNESAWTRYMSDESFYEIILENLASNKNSNQFIYGVSMQNHAPFFTTQNYFKDEIKFDLENELNKPILGRYFLGLKETDRATKDFIDEINNREKKTIVVFFGDHPINYNLFESKKNETLEENPSNYDTPYFVYANFKTPKIGEKNNVAPGELGIEVEQMLGIDNLRIRTQSVFYNKIKDFTKTHAFLSNLYKNPKYNSTEIFKNYRTIFDDDFFGENHYQEIRK